MTNLKIIKIVCAAFIMSWASSSAFAMDDELGNNRYHSRPMTYHAHNYSQPQLESVSLWRRFIRGVRSITHSIDEAISNIATEVRYSNSLLREINHTIDDSRHALNHFMRDLYFILR
jgi:hypothetical protein